MTKYISIIFVLALMFLCSKPAQADWLGLAPGDYNVTLDNSSFSCGGNNCIGTVHIGSPGSTGFDWLFSITSPFPTTLDCAPCFPFETATFQLTGESNLVFGGLFEGLHLEYSKTTGSLIYDLFCVNEANYPCPGFGSAFLSTGAAIATPAIPEPSSLTLTLLGYVMVTLRRRLW